MKIALIGNPNSGKTTLFNNLTGLNQTVGNWTGVTIEKKIGKYLKDKSINIIDLPGIYSLTSYSLEEKISRNYIFEDKPDVIINVVDATNLERNLYLTTQLQECNIPIVIALNMYDELKRNGITIDDRNLEQKLNIPVMPISALKNRNIDKLMELALNTKGLTANHIRFNGDIENALSYIKEATGEESRFRLIKMFERDSIYYKSIEENQINKINTTIKLIEDKLLEPSVEIISNSRYNHINSIIINIQSKKASVAQGITEKIDRIVTNKYLAFPIFAAVIFLMYFISITWLGGITIELMEGLVIEGFGGLIESLLINANASEWLISLTVDGIIAGVGTILTFIPQILILFLFISILEGCGYMARVAYIMDRLFKRIGLSGKSFIPLIIGCGCSVPAIMSSRTIENNDERRLTIMLTPFIPCSAKLPVFALFAAAFFPSNPFTAPSMYLLGIFMVIISGLILKKLRIFKTESDTFILELPQYRIPKFSNVMLQLWEKGKSFLIKAGTIIFVASMILWFLQSFNFRLEMIEPDVSMLASIGRFIAPIFVPLGFGSWQASVSIFTGFFAKEIVVSTLSILLGAGDGEVITPEFTSQLATLFSPLAAYSFMAFILLAAPCLAAIGATRREMGGYKWMFIALGFQTLMAYLTSLVIYQTGMLFGTNKVIFITIVALLLIGIMTALSISSIKKRKGKYCGNDCSKCNGMCSSTKE